jgi:hypothetical protein
MTISQAEIGKTIFKRSEHINMSDFSNDIKTFNVLFALDGRRSVQTIASEDNFDIDELSNKMKDLYDRGMIEKTNENVISRGRSKKLLDAIILKRSRGVGAIAKAIKIKIALKGINPDHITEDTPDDPALLMKLIALARSYGLVVKNKAERTKGRIKLLIDSIITQRSGGDPMVAKMLKTKFMLKGINPDAYSLDTPDDPSMVRKLTDLANKLGIKIPNLRAHSAEKIEKML